MHSSPYFMTSYAPAIVFKGYRDFRFHQRNKIVVSYSSLFSSSSTFSSSFSSSLPSSSSFSSSSSSTPTFSLSQNWEHDVFPTFHGADVRENILSHILENFKRKGIDVFIDNEIKRGKSILLSEKYCSSTWCLNELAEIVKCDKYKEGVEEPKLTVMVIFYGVDPTDVKKQTGKFGDVFKDTCKGKTDEEIEEWKKALVHVAKIGGYHPRNWENEAVMIEKLATHVSDELNNYTPSTDFEGLFGMRSHMKKLTQLLCLEDLQEVRMIGIWGPLGIGKTTIARFLVNQLSNRFELSTIMTNIKTRYPRPYLDEYDVEWQLQNQLVSQITNQKDTKIAHLGVAKDRLKHKRVFVVLDDVDNSTQLDALAKETQRFGPGSRIIITTEDRRLLKAHGINHIYKVDVPLFHEALQIFCMSAFGQKSPKEGFEELAWEVTYLTGELPLGLKVMGSYCKAMTKQEWKDALPRLRNSLDGDIESILKFSYDSLSEKDKDLFLYIACIFNNITIARGGEYLVKKFPDVLHGFHILAEKSLISIDSGYLEMRNLLVQLGKEIVFQQSVREPGKRQFLVDSKEICEVLSDDAAGSRSVIGISFHLFEITKTLNISERAFEGMSNLQFLRFYSFHGMRAILNIPHGLNYLSRKLQLLHWIYFPMTCLSFIDNPELLVELIMCHSKLEKFWEGIKPLRNLKWMDLSWSLNLKELPDLSTATSLKELNLTRCSNLVELPSSIGNATNLEMLILSNCSSLVELPFSIGNVINLQRLDLYKCLSLVKLPSSIGKATNLVELNLSGCSSLVELPSSIGNLTNLRILNLSNCSSLLELPSSIGDATNLVELDLSGCSSLVKLPSSIGNASNLQILNLPNCSSLVELPSSIGNVTKIQKLDLKGCSNLVQLPSSVGNVTNLKVLDLSGCSKLVELSPLFGNATKLVELNLSNCLSLVKLPSSIESAKNLQKLNLSGCSNLVELPSSIVNATSLQKLNLEGCSNLMELPSFIGNAINLVELDLSGCSSMVKLPSSIGNSTNLQVLNLSNCSSLLELPSSIGDATSLQRLLMNECSNLVGLPSSIGNATSLMDLDLSGCSKMVELPSSIGNAINLTRLDLSKCSGLVELPSSIGNAKNLEYLQLNGCSSLVELSSFTHLVKGISRLQRLFLSRCTKLVSISQLPDSLEIIEADNCESLERLDCSFVNPNISLNFANCFKLNKEARDLIIRTSPSDYVILPGGKVPTYFSNQATGDSVAVKLSERPFPASLRFKACISLVDNGYNDWIQVAYRITDKQNGTFVERKMSCGYLSQRLKEHLFTFEFEAEVTSSELVFEFEYLSQKAVIKECGVLQLVH